MEQFSKFSLNRYQHRQIIGYLGLSLPFILFFGNLVFGCTDVQNSISHYYHTYMRDVLVAVIILISLFFICYTGYKKDRIPFKIAGFAALLVGFFPTSLDANVAECCQEFATTNRDFSISKWIHYIAATVFFITLTYICLFLFTKPKPKYKEQKLRNLIIKICGYVMLLVVLFLGASFIFKFEKQTGDINLLFYGETLALLAFSIAWLVKGRFMTMLDNKTLL